MSKSIGHVTLTNVTVVGPTEYNAGLIDPSRLVDCSQMEIHKSYHYQEIKPIDSKTMFLTLVGAAPESSLFKKGFYLDTSNYEFVLMNSLGSLILIPLKKGH